MRVSSRNIVFDDYESSQPFLWLVLGWQIFLGVFLWQYIVGLLHHLLVVQGDHFSYLWLVIVLLSHPCLLTWNALLICFRHGYETVGGSSGLCFHCNLVVVGLVLVVLVVSWGYHLTLFAQYAADMTPFEMLDACLAWNDFLRLA